MDVYVVDNASTDASVICIKKEYEDKVTIIENPENLGGSGGFNTGLIEVLKKDYKYVMCVDNDIVMDKYNVEGLYRYLEDHPEVGMVGSRVMIMDQPDRIQAMGAQINLDTFSYQDNYRNYLMNSGVPKVVECDYVPACSMMVRTEAIHKVGVIPADTFIYWDDMEWGHRFQLAGYKIVCYSEAVVWHKGNFKSTTTFGKYYMWRNRINYFTKYLREDKLDDFTDKILSELFQMIYACNYKGELNIIKTLMYAYDDALHGVRGKADQTKIFERDKVANKIDVVSRNAERVILLFDGNYEALGEIINRLHKINANMDILVSVSKEVMEQVHNQFPQVKVTSDSDILPDIIVMKMCSHIFDVSEYRKDMMYIDRWCNLIENEEDFTYCKSFRQNLELFINCRKPVFMYRIMKLREELSAAGKLMGKDILL
jgi:GT2 family glycosyltransferase